MKTNLLNKVSRGLHKVGFGLKKHSPEILVAVGIGTGIASGVMACKATLKVNEVLDKAKEDIDKIHTVAEDVTMVNQYSEQDMKKDLTIVYAKTGVELAKLYGPSLLLGTVSITSILASTNILKKRNAALTAAYATVEKGFKKYRDNVVERFGEKVDRELKYGIKAKVIEETVVDEDGVETKVTNEVDVVDPLSMYSPYARFYDDGCTGWSKDPEYNLMQLRALQAYANDKLIANGYLFLNEVYDMLGIPKSKEGQVIGWKYCPKDTTGTFANHVDFGIYDYRKAACREFVNGYERVILLDFNVDGNIYDLM